MRLVIGGIAHESHSFSPIKATVEKFKECSLVEGREILQVYQNTGTVIGGFLGANTDIELFPAIYMEATPSGPVTDETLDYFYGNLTRSLRKAKPFNGLCLALHGAMITESHLDAEGFLLRHLREAIGDKAPIAITLDLHANVSELMVDMANIVVGYKTYPHIDQYDRGRDTCHLIKALIDGKINPVKAFIKLPMMPPSMNMRSEAGPMAALLNQAAEWEKQDGVLNVSLFGGYPYADIPDVGFSVLVTTDNDRELARTIAEDLARKAWKVRNDFIVSLPTVEEGVKEAIDSDLQPVILVDVADNPGSGGFADTPTLLNELLRQKAEEVGFAIICDPESVLDCLQAGVGATVKLHLGGKTDPSYGKPIPVEGRVKTICDGRFVNKGPMNYGVEVNMGRTVLFKARGIDIIITERCKSPNDPEIFRMVGIEPKDRKILALKAKIHFEAGYKSFAKKIIPVDSFGVATLDLTKFDYKNIPRPIFPLQRTLDVNVSKLCKIVG